MATELPATTVAEAGMAAGKAVGAEEDELEGDGSHSTEKYVLNIEY